MKLRQLFYLWLCVLCLGTVSCSEEIMPVDPLADADRWELELNILFLQREVRYLKEKGVPCLAEVRAGSVEGTQSIAHIIRRLKPHLRESIVTEIDTAIVKYSEQYRIPPEFIVYLMDRESDFRPQAISSVGAIGLMQIFTKYHKDKMELLGIQHLEVYEIDNNIHLGCWILREYLDQTGSIDKALTRYVGGKHPSYVRDILSGYANEMIESGGELQ